MTEQDDPEIMLIKKETISILLGMITMRERSVIMMRFGIGGGGEKTLKCVVSLFGVTSERIRQIERHALAVIRRSAGTEMAW